jgi:arabinogalactan oligomer/maltooligosaccharide transport system permease protein
VSTIDEAQAVATPAAQVKRRRKQRPKWRENWWRHLVALIAIVFALFPVVYVVSGAFNADGTLAAAKLIPRKVTFSNFTELFTNKQENARATGTNSSHYAHWYLNSLIVATVTSLLTVMLGALAAYAFSRFRFKGRRMGLLSLLLIQMFPALLAVVAIYLIVLHVGDVFPRIGLNTLAGLIIVYLGGVMGVNTWLMKGFLDSIPNELDESARVDGATPAQTFWGVILPLAAPVLAVIGLLSFIGTINEFIIASVLLQTADKWTLPVGMYGYVNDQYAQHWGPFAAGVILAAIPVVVVFMSLQRFIVHGLTQGSVKG